MFVLTVMFFEKHVKQQH